MIVMSGKRHVACTCLVVNTILNLEMISISLSVAGFKYANEFLTRMGSFGLDNTGSFLLVRNYVLGKSDVKK